jgi:hypothetical protein
MKILYFDIEATNLSASMGYVLVIGYKWAGEKDVHILRIDQTKEGKKHKTDDIGLLNAFEKVFGEAEIVVGHYLEFYDIPFLQTRRLMKGLKPMPVAAQCDTWRIAKKRLKFHSNRLAAIISALKCPFKKTELKGDIWIEAMAGDKKAIDYVATHCKYDVLSLEWIYNKLRPYWDRHPRVVMDNEDRKCRLCGKKSVSYGVRVCQGQRYRRMVCQHCGFNWKSGVIKNGK